MRPWRRYQQIASVSIRWQAKRFAAFPDTI